MKPNWMRLLYDFPRDTGAGAGGGAPPPPPPAGPWYTGKLDPEEVGYLQNRGLHEKDPVEVAVAAIKSHRESERLLGVPKDQLVRIPDNKDPAVTRAFWQKFGAPAEAKEYDFPALKDQSGKVQNEKLDAALRDTAFKLSIPKETASEIAKTIVATLDAQEAEQKAAAATKLDAERAELAKNWGTNVEANKLVARDGARKLGLDPEAVTALEKVNGYAKVMEALRRVGAVTGEDVFIKPPSGNNAGVLTLEQAKDKKASLMADSEWSKRYLAGGAVETREMMSLNTIIASAMPA